MGSLDFFQTAPGTVGDINEVLFDPQMKRFAANEKIRDKKIARGLAAQKKGDTEKLIKDLENTTTDKEETAVLARLAAVQGPAFAQSVGQSLARADKNELADAQLKADQGFKIASGLRGIDPAKRDPVIRQLIQEKRARQEPTDRLESLLGKSGDEQDTLLRVMEITSQGIKDLTTKQGKRLDAKLKSEEAFTLGKDQERFQPGTPAQPGQPGTEAQQIAAGPTTSAEGKVIGKVNPKDFTPESLQSFVKGGMKDFSKLKLKPTAPNATVMSALLPLILGGVDINDPQALAEGLGTVTLIGKALSGATAKELTDLQKNLPKRTPKPPEEKKKGLLEKSTDLAKKGFQEFSKAQAKYQNLLKEVARKYLPGQEADQVEDSLDKSNGFAEWTVQRMSKVMPNAVTDEQGFYYIPNKDFPGGKQFLRDKGKAQGGRKIRRKE